ncbi:MAG: DUF4340 domain-containing protein [Bdellovibrio sp.]
MKLKGRTILVLTLLLFGGYAYYDHVQDQKKEAQRIEDSRLLSLNYEQIDGFEIHKGEQKVVVKRDVNGWALAEPLQDGADNEAVEDFIKNIVPEKVLEVAKEDSELDWSLYGLDKPLGTIRFKTSSGEESVFTVSEKRNFEDNAFVRRNQENKVLVVNSLWQSRVQKSANDFRDRRLLRQKIASVDELKLKNEKGLLHIRRVEGQWKSVSPSGAKLDQNKVRELLTALAEAKASEIYGQKERLPSRKSLFTMDLLRDGKSWSADVGQAQDRLIYTKISEYPFQMKMDAGALDKFIKISLNDLKEVEKKQEGTEATPASDQKDEN